MAKSEPKQKSDTVLMVGGQAVSVKQGVAQERVKPMSKTDFIQTVRGLEMDVADIRESIESISDKVDEIEKAVFEK